MTRVIGIALIASVLISALGYIYIENSHSATVEKSSNPLYKLHLVDSDNKSYDLSELNGKVAIVNFWATYCGPCRDEMPDLSSVNDSYQGKDVLVLGIAADELSNIKEFLETTKVSYKNLAAEFDAIELSNKFGNESSVLPFTVILDPEGNVLYRHAGRIIPEKIREIVDLALSKK